MNNWKETTLGEIAKITRGSSPRPIHDFIRDAGIPWIKIADATSSQDRYIRKTKEFIKKEGANNSVEVRKGDLILSNSATPGIPKILKIDACIHDGWLLFRDIKVDKYYLYYFLTYSLKNLIHSASGTVFKNLKTDIVKAIDINLPPPKEQKAIAKALSSLDDKIELLRKQNETLEKIAQTIFRRWFVEFEFPDKNSKPYKSSGGKMVESELGEIPEGWRVGKLGDEFEIIMGQSPKGETYNETRDGMIFFQGRAEFQERFPKVRLYTTDPKRIAERFDVLVSVRAPVGDINIALSQCCIGRGIGAVRSKYKSYCLYKIKFLKDVFKKFEAEGTVFGSINKNSFSDIKVVVPSNEMVDSFEKIINSMDKKIFKNNNQIQTLSRLRDTLLPKLMSGEVKVKKS